MNTFYQKTEWENTPSTNTPINEDNLNNIENGVSELDGRVSELSNTKSNVDWVQLQQGGDKIAEITIDGVKKNVYMSDSYKSAVERAEWAAEDAERNRDETSQIKDYVIRQAMLAQDSAIRSQSFSNHSQDEADRSAKWAKTSKEYAEEAKQTDVGTLTARVDVIDEDVTGLKESFTQYEQSGFLSRNLLDMSDLASWYAQDTVWQRKLVKVKANTSYTVSTDTNNGTLAMCLFGASDDITTTLTTSANGVFKEAPRTVTSTSNGNVLILINKNFPNAKVQLEEGTEASSYTPYAPSNAELNKSLSQLQTVSRPSITLSSDVTSGSISCSKIGRMVIVRFWAVVLNKANTTVTVASNVPSCTSDDLLREASVLRCTNTSNTALVWVSGTSIAMSADSTSGAYYGELIYIADN